MGKLEDWQPLFRFLERLDDSKVLGLVFLLVFTVGVVIAWYWACFRNGAESWRNEIILWNKRMGVKIEWIAPCITLFSLKVGATIGLVGTIVGASLVVIAEVKNMFD